ncbi:hypothetical protein [Halobacteriovorax sp. HLS]|uniref:hypothetical protein n=1 Tax=Halobacteriovorax sp. HLS TaxID=2234000 RepID=UPI000FDC2D43|nr:hypothetical protein [Halobacteriovorax sp. HLS]
MSNEIDEGHIKEAVIDKVQEMFELAKKELQKVECPEHGKALNSLEFDRANGRFKIDTCCPVGENLVNEAIIKL